MWFLKEIYAIKHDDLQGVLNSVATLFIESENLIIGIVPDKNAVNESYDMTLSLPCQLFKLDMCSLVSVIITHRVRLKRRFYPTKINQIADNLVHMNRAYLLEYLFNNSIDSRAIWMYFERFWDVMAGIFEVPMIFCGGLMIFPNKATLE